MHKKIIETRSFAPHAAEITKKRDEYFSLFDRYIRNEMLKQGGFKNDLPITAHFLIDGSAILPFSEFSGLPEWMKAFFKNGRVSRPSEVQVFSDYASQGSELAFMRNTSQHIALRGGRFWDYDGSKAPHGPDYETAVDLLFDNIDGDLQVLDQLLVFQPRNEFEWVARIAVWEYIRNDFCALYYALKCMNSITNEPAHLLGLADKALEFVSNHYFESILLSSSNKLSGSEAFLELMQYKKQLSEKIKQMVTSDKQGRDLIRSHREVNNPLALLNAFRLVYEYDGHTLQYTDDIKTADAILAPLYGGIDLVYAFRYALGQGQYFVERLFKAELQDSRREIKVLPVLSKFGAKGKVRSQLTKAEQTISALDSDQSSGDREKSWLAKELPDATTVLLIDDSLATGGSNVVLNEWIDSALGRKINTKLRVTYSNLRWAKYQSPLEKLMEARPLAQSPIIRNMEKASYNYGSRFIPDAVSSGLVQRTDLSFLNLDEVLPVLIEKYEKKIIKGVGFDLDDTLIFRTVDTKQRRKIITVAILGILAEYGIQIAEEKYATLSYSIIQSERVKSHQDPDHPIYIFDYNKVILNELGVTDETLVTFLAQKMTDAELEIDKTIVVAAPGAKEMLTQLTVSGIPYAIFSNSHYTNMQIMQILSAVNLSEYFQAELITTSSEKGIPQKPNPGAIRRFVAKMNIDSKELAYIGNSFASDVIGANKAGSIAFYVPAEIDLKSKNDREKIARWRENLIHA